MLLESPSGQAPRSLPNASAQMPVLRSSGHAKASQLSRRRSKNLPKRVTRSWLSGRFCSPSASPLSRLRRQAGYACADRQRYAPQGANKAIACQRPPSKGRPINNDQALLAGRRESAPVPSQALGHPARLRLVIASTDRPELGCIAAVSPFGLALAESLQIGDLGYAMLGQACQRQAWPS